MDWKSKKYELPESDWRYKRAYQGLELKEYALTAAAVGAIAFTLFAGIASLVSLF